MMPDYPSAAGALFMLDYVYNHDELVSRFVTGLIPHCHRGFGNCKTKALVYQPSMHCHRHRA